MFDNYLELIVSLHKDGWSPWEWNQVANAPPPPQTHDYERVAHGALVAYQPTLVDRTLGKDHIVRSQLEAAVHAARQQDAGIHQQIHAQWEWYRRVGHGVIQGDLAAYRTVLEHLMPFEELEQLGTAVGLRSEAPWYVEADVMVGDEDVIPAEERKLLASGKVSVKDMPKAKYWALYQDHVCSAALRVGRELFALLPVNTVFVHVGQRGLDSATGHHAVVPLVSASFDRASFMTLSFDRLDPSDAVSRFTHRMKFKKTTGFSPIEPIAPGNSMTSS